MAKGKKTGGGPRKGIPNKTTQHLREVIEAEISTEERIGLLAELARGVTVEETYKNGGPVIYTRPPDAFAIRQLNENQYGKPREAVDVNLSPELFEIIIGKIGKRKAENQNPDPGT